MSDPSRFGRFEIRLTERKLWVDGQPAALGARAFDLLAALVERRDRVVPKAELLDLVWPGLVVEENNLQVQVSALRKLLGAGAIATVPGRGYQFTLSAARSAASIPVQRMHFAVLPFEAPADNTEAQALARHLFEATESHQTSNYLWASVAPRADVERALAAHPSPMALGRALGVRFILRGRVSRVIDGHTLLLTLADATSERVLQTRTLRVDAGSAAAGIGTSLTVALGYLTYSALQVEVAEARTKPDEQLDARDLAFRAYVDWQHSGSTAAAATGYVLARKSLDRALAMAPDDLLALQGLVHINLFCNCSGEQVPGVQERERLAVDAMDRYLRLRPDSTHMLMLRSYVFHKNKRQIEALHVTDEVLRLSPEDADALAMRAGILFEMKRYPEARDALPAMLQAMEDAQRHALAAATHFAVRDDDAAVHHARKAISQMDGQQAADPQFGSVRLTLAAAEARAGRLDNASTALADFRTAVPQVQTVTQVKSWLTDTSPVLRDAMLYDGLQQAGMPE